jgi:hypothetical protein
MAQPSLKIRQHALDATSVFGTHVVGGTKSALTLGRLLGEDVALECVAALELAGSGLPEALGCGPIGLHLGHGWFLERLDGRGFMSLDQAVAQGHSFLPARTGLFDPFDRIVVRSPASQPELLARLAAKSFGRRETRGGRRSSGSHTRILAKTFCRRFSGSWNSS